MGNKIRDHTNKEFQSIEDMVAYWEVNINLFNARMDRFRDIEYALTGKMSTYHKVICGIVSVHSDGKYITVLTETSTASTAISQYNKNKEIIDREIQHRAEEYIDDTEIEYSRTELDGSGNLKFIFKHKSLCR